MISFKKKDTKVMLKAVARAYGVSVAAVRSEIQATIADARNNPDPEKQAEFRKYFGGQDTYCRRIYRCHDKEAERLIFHRSNFL